MDRESIAAIHARHWRKGWGSVTVEEAGFILDAVAARRPRRFVEIGTASGLSGALIRLMLAAHGGERFVTHDVTDRFFGDTSRETGFLLEEVGGAEGVSVSRHVGRGAADLISRSERFDMAFVDANHRHPWPLLDSLYLAEVLEGSRIVIHHDLLLHRRGREPSGIGPKHLFDQAPEGRRRAGGGGNIFMLDLSMKRAELAALAVSALHLPWSLDRPMSAEAREAARAMLKRSLPGHVLSAFDRAAAKFDRAAPGWVLRRGLLGRLFP